MWCRRRQWGLIGWKKTVTHCVTRHTIWLKFKRGGRLIYNGFNLLILDGCLKLNNQLFHFFTFSLFHFLVLSLAGPLFDLRLILLRRGNFSTSHARMEPRLVDLFLPTETFLWRWDFSISCATTSFAWTEPRLIDLFLATETFLWRGDFSTRCAIPSFARRKLCFLWPELRLDFLNLFGSCLFASRCCLTLSSSSVWPTIRLVKAVSLFALNASTICSIPS